MPSSNPVWYQIVIAVVSGVVVGQLAPGVIGLVTRPRLRIRLDTPERTHYQRPVAGKSDVDGRWLGVWVEQRRLRLGRTPALDCVAELVSVERIEAGGLAKKVGGFEPDLASWAAMGERGFEKRDIYPGQPVRISLCWKESDAPSVLYWDIQRTKVASGRASSVAPGVYRVRLRVYSSTAAWTEATFEVQHGHGFSELEVRQVR
jgi:hypothetical protein